MPSYLPRPALRLDRLEDRSVPAAFRFGLTGADVAKSIAADTAGNMYVCGTFIGDVDFDPGPGTSTLTHVGNLNTPDLFLAKYSAAGGLIWVGSLGEGSAEDLAVDSAGAVYITGHFGNAMDFDLGPGFFHLFSTTRPAAYVAKYNPDRGLAWARKLGGEGATAQGHSIALDGAGNVYSTGFMDRGTTDFDPGPGTFELTNASNFTDVYISKLDPLGNFVWARAFNCDPNQATAIQHSRGLAVDAAQNVYVTGMFGGRVDFDPGPGTYWVEPFDDPPIVGGGDGVVVKLTAAGDLGWVVRIGASTYPDEGRGIAVDAAGNAYATGVFGGTATVDAVSGATTLTSAGFGDLYVVKLDPTGALGWARPIGGSLEESGRDIVPDGEGGVHVAGYFGDTVDFDPGPGVQLLTYAGGFSDIFALQLRGDGSFATVAGFGGSTIDFPNGIAVTPGGGFAVAGQFRGTADFDPGPGVLNLSSAGDYDGFVAVPPRPPVASDGTLVTDEDTAATGTLAATDPNGDPVTYRLVSTADAHGTVTLTDPATGAYTYTPDPDFNGPAGFTFLASDGQADSNVATVSITVHPVNDPPAAADDAAAVFPDSESSPIDVLGNDSSAPDAGEVLTITAVTLSAHGTVAVTGGGTGLTYTPAEGYAGPDGFTYTIADGNGGTDTAAVTVTVAPAAGNTPPTAVVDAVAMAEDAGPQAIDVLANDATAPDAGEALTVRLVTRPAHGTATIAADRKSIRYTADPDFAGTDTFYYVVADGRGARASAPVVVTVMNDAADRLEVVPSAGLLRYTEGDGGKALDGGLQVGSAAGDLVTRAVLRFSAGYVKGRDVLSFAPVNGIKGKFSPATGTLTLTGKAPPDVYESALQTVQYANRSDHPVGGSRTVSITLFDAFGAGSSADRRVQVTAVNDGPTVTLPPTVAAARVGRPAAVLAGIRLTDPDSAFLVGATVTVGNVQAGDELRVVTTGTGLTAAYTNGVLSIRGTASAATYRKVLQSVRFVATGGPGVVRTLTVTAEDEFQTGDPATRTVAVG